MPCILDPRDSGGSVNIAIVGPEKFAFQDMVCVELALALRGTGSFALVPEPTGGEDARLTWSDDALSILEVQVKGASGTLTIGDLVEYLAHYPEKAETPSLLRRLMDEDETYSIFILSARCGDDLVDLLSPKNRARQPSRRPVSRTLAQNVRDEVARRAKTLGGQELTRLYRGRGFAKESLQSHSGCPMRQPEESGNLWVSGSLCEGI